VASLKRKAVKASAAAVPPSKGDASSKKKAKREPKF
jgi:hypothetical protein